MNRTEDDLISRYAKTIELANESVGKNAGVFPETILPAPKSEIAAALRVDLARETDPTTRDLLKSAYVMLADFVPAEDWIICWRVMEKIMPHELSSKLLSQPSLSDGERSHYMRLAASVPDEDLQRRQVVVDRQQAESRELLRDTQQFD